MATSTNIMAFTGLLWVLAISLDLTSASGNADQGDDCRTEECMEEITCQDWKDGERRCLPKTCKSEGERCGWAQGKCCTAQDVYCYKMPGGQNVCTPLDDIPTADQTAAQADNV